MGCKRIFLWILLGGITFFSACATITNMGARSVEHPAGIDLKDESIRSHRAGFFGYYGRSYHGGGIRMGK